MIYNGFNVIYINPFAISVILLQFITASMFCIMVQTSLQCRHCDYFTSPIFLFKQRDQPFAWVPIVVLNCTMREFGAIKDGSYSFVKKNSTQGKYGWCTPLHEESPKHHVHNGNLEWHSKLVVLLVGGPKWLLCRWRSRVLGTPPTHEEKESQE
jgi:hypothetical protein